MGKIEITNEDGKVIGEGFIHIHHKPGTIVVDKKEYRSLKKKARVLAALEGYGVSEWEGYDDAIENYNESYYHKYEK